MLLSANPVRAEWPTESEPPSRSIWSENLPEVETRIFFAWPDFLGIRRVDFPPEGAKSVSLSPPKSRFQDIFGDLNWLNRDNPIPSVSQQEPIIIRAESASLKRSFFPSWDPVTDHQVTLVRGGPPPLIGGRARIRGEYGDEFDEVKRIRGQVLWSFNNRIGIDASVNHWDDDRPGLHSLGKFWTGDANLVYSMGAQRIAMRGGVGAAWVYDQDFEVGYNLMYGADLFLTRPWLLSGEIDWGQINNEKLLHWRATAGVQVLFFELYVGYDSYEWDKFRFAGPVAGAGFGSKPFCPQDLGKIIALPKNVEKPPPTT